MADVLESSSPIARVTITTGLAYEQLRTYFERELGHYDHDAGAHLVEAKASWTTVCQAIGAMSGPHGLILMQRVDQGQIASLKGRVRHCTLYLVGNPIIASEILDIDLRAGLLVPFRVEVFEDGDGGMLSYDLPSSSLASLGHVGLDAIAADLDSKMEAVVSALSPALVA